MSRARGLGEALASILSVLTHLWNARRFANGTLGLVPRISYPQALERAFG
jgi:hypothetical protein